MDGPACSNELSTLAIGLAKSCFVPERGIRRQAPGGLVHEI